MEWLLDAAPVAEAVGSFSRAGQVPQPTAFSCTSDQDCQLNGVCATSSGVCVCDAAWSGQDCGMLNVLPAKLNVSFHDAVLYCTNPSSCGMCLGVNDQATSWGGSILKIDGQYVMLAAEMTNNCTLGSWQTNSEVVLAVAKSPQGPYEERYSVAEPWAHNPQYILASDGTYVLFTLGDGIQGPHGPPVNCADSNTTARSPVASENETPTRQSGSAVGNHTVHFMLHYTTDPLGTNAWNAYNASIEDFPVEYQFPGNWNPAPVSFADGRVRIVVHTNTSPWGGEVIVEAAHWKGPYKPLTTDITSCTKCAEDPFMWQDARGNFHILYHRMFDPAGPSPIPSPGWCGGHSFSSDGLQWSPITRAYNTSVSFQDGTKTELSRRERPKLLFADGDAYPTHISNGVQLSSGETYTLVTPLCSPSLRADGEC